jgi:hypothetical protein
MKSWSGWVKSWVMSDIFNDRFSPHVFPKVEFNQNEIVLTGAEYEALLKAAELLEKHTREEYGWKHQA